LIFGAANMALGALPLLLMMLYCLGWTIARPFWRFTTVLLANFFLIFTGYGVVMGVVTPVAILASLWISQRDRSQLVNHLSALAASLASLGLFFVNYRWNPDVDCYSSVLASKTPTDYFRFASLMWANYLGFDGISSKHPAV